MELNRSAFCQRFAVFVLSESREGSRRDVSSLGLISPTAKMLPSPQESPHIISYAFHFGVLFINQPDQRPIAFELLAKKKKKRDWLEAFQVI